MQLSLLRTKEDDAVAEFYRRINEERTMKTCNDCESLMDWSYTVDRWICPECGRVELFKKEECLGDYSYEQYNKEEE